MSAFCHENLEIFEKSQKIVNFRYFAVSELFPSQRAQKMLQNEPLDVKKFDDSAENEAFQISKTVKIAGLHDQP
jgi:hypothetical protein